MKAINTLLAQALTGDATLADLEAVAPATIAGLPDPLLLAFIAIQDDMIGNGTADADRILSKANGHAGPLRETFIELLDMVPEDAPLILDPSAPLDCARAYLDRRHTRDGARILLHHRGEFYAWRGTEHRVMSDGELRCDLWGFLDGASRRAKIEKEWSIVPFKPNKVRIGDTFDGLRAAANIPASIDPPAFLDDPARSARNLLPLRNGVLDAVTRELIPHSPRLFNLGSADYDFDPNATAPAWEAFQDSLFDDDLESRDTLEEILGLFLVPDTKYQKLFLIVGPRRAGKGVIGRLIPRLIGRRRVATPNITSLGEPFGLQELVGKTVAVIGDVRLRADAEEVAGNLLAISGEDGVTVRRKFKEDLSGNPLPVRFLLFSNELPHLDDPSGALSSRFIIVQLTESFLGREDPDLEANLEMERPGILNRCLDGLQRLRDRGRFIQPSSGAAAVEALEALASPHRVFLGELFEWNLGAEVPVDTVFVEWEKWCGRNGRKFVGDKARLGRDLRTASDGKLPKTAQRGTGKDKIRVYPGMRLK